MRICRINLRLFCSTICTCILVDLLHVGGRLEPIVVIGIVLAMEMDYIGKVYLIVKIDGAQFY